MDPHISAFLQLYESLEATCQAEIKSAPEKAAVPTTVLLALRDRLTRLVGMNRLSCVCLFLVGPCQCTVMLCCVDKRCMP